ncbi:hypothetical protein BH11VER1_BH11VER1_23390 [soil metagenome]
MCSQALVQAELRHRWSFNATAGSIAAGTSFVDSASGALATVVGTAASSSGTAITLPGSAGNSNVAANTIPAYLDLPNGLISSKTNLTVEIWATVISARSNQRLFDFGRMNIAGIGTGAAPGEITNNSTTAPGTSSISDDLNMNVSSGGSLNAQRLESRINGGTSAQLNSTLTTTANTESHYAITFANGVGTYPSTGGRVTFYRDGTLIGSVDLPHRLSDIEDVNNWLGRSQNVNDYTSNIAYNEVRIFDHAFNQSEVTASRIAGANAVIAVKDSVTMNLGQKARISVLANDDGSPIPATVVIVQPPQFGTAVPDSAGRILYAHISGAPTNDTFTYRVNNAAGTSNPATVTINFASGLRIANSNLNVPSAPPSTTFQLVNAFPGVTTASPTCIASAPGDTKRLFILEKGGQLKTIPDVTATTPTSTTFLNLSALLTSRGESISTNSEQGLLGLAFHPNYTNNRYFYIFYSVNKTGGTFERLSRFRRDVSNPALADSTSELVLLEQLDEAGNHNGGCLQFGPDGYLYVSFGDEGNQNDFYNNSQLITKDFFSAIIRIDVDKKVGSLNPNNHAAVLRDSGVARYAVPPDNPYVGATTFNGAAVTAANVHTEFWAVGLRNPWRFSFDPPTGDLWLGDVGGSLREEVNIVTKGANYGWALREGMVDGPKSAQAPANFDTLYGTRPIYDYPHGSGTYQGNSITGGVVYRGSRFQSLQGAYIFADYVTPNIWTLQRNGANPPTVTRILGEGGISAFGTDPSNGDVLLADYNDNRILRLVTGATGGTFPQNLSETNLFADMSDLAPAPGLLPYSVNLPFWSDYAIKRRWMVIPDGVSQISWSRDGLWTFPNGTIWVKHFDMEMTRGNPATKKRIETRLLVKNTSGAYGVSYRWNDAQTEAALVPDEGVDFSLNITEGGSPVIQNWHIPSRGECMSCHTSQAGFSLSSNTRQFNRTETINGYAGNQIELLRSHGFFSNTPESPNVLPRHLAANETSFPVESRVRSYLAVNCSYCHKENGTASPAVWDGRPEISLAQTGLLNGNATNNGGSSANKLIVPGDTLHSIVLNRVAVTNGFTRMPPLGSSQLDQNAIALLTEWIGSSQLANRKNYDQWRLEKFGSTSSPSGEPTANPDQDSHTNQEEFLLGTDPWSGQIIAAPLIATNVSVVSITFNVPANRVVQIETSPDLLSWSLWDVPGNDAIARSSGPSTFTGPRLGATQFFRIKVAEY